MAAKACVLCGTTPPPPLTKEHIWPEWYNRKNPTRRYQLEALYGDVERVNPARSLNLKPRVLCQRCNSVWGSRLESLIEPILTPMLDGSATSLTLREMGLLVGWFTLKCMASKYLVPNPDFFFSPEDGAHLRATLLPPSSACVWIGRYVGSTGGGSEE